ncbi:unnamed protein product [Ostreobium quekettii]|uniref:GRIP domain-containing protein n=1 Tax=Ostreobium quekettii TaxID=121088 RepID=A0A8S1J4Q5_9CHLO|nr:unnamed protein product [Ostreobium quekettii]
MESPRSVCSEASNVSAASRVPASIAGASRDELQRKLLELLKRLKARDAKIKEGSARLQAGADQLASAQREVKRLRDEARDRDARWERELADLRAGAREAEEAKSLVASLKAGLEGMAEERDAAYAKISEGKENVSALEEGLSLAQARAREAQARLSEVEGEARRWREAAGRLGELERGLGDRAEALALAEARQEALERQLADGREAMEAMKAAHAEARDAARKRITDLEGQVRDAMKGGEAGGGLEAAKARVGELEGRAAALREGGGGGESGASAYVEELEARARERAEQCAEVEKRLAEVQGKLEEQKRYAEALQGTVESLQSQQQQLIASEKAANSQRGQKAAEIEQRGKKVEADLQGQLQGVKQKVAEAEERSDEFRELTAERLVAESPRKRLDAKAHELEVAAKSAVGKLEKEGEQQKQLTRELGDHEAQQSALLEKSQSHEQQCIKLTEELADCKKKFAAAARKMQQEQQNTMGELQTRIKHLEAEKARSSRLEKEASAAEKLLKEARSTVHERSDALGSLQSQMEMAKSECSKLQESKAAASKLQVQLERKSHELVEARQEVDQLKEASEGDKEKMKRGVVELKKRLDRARKEEVEAAGQRGRLEAEIESLKRELNSARQEVEKGAADLKEYRARAHALLKEKEAELARLRLELESQTKVDEGLEVIKAELEVVQVERDQFKAEVSESEGRFQSHLDEITADFQQQLDAKSGEALGYRSAAIQKELQEIKSEFKAYKGTAEQLGEAKDGELSRLLEINAELRQQLKVSKTSPIVPETPESNVGEDDAAVGANPPDVSDDFEFGTFLNDHALAAPVTSPTAQSTQETPVAAMEGTIGDSQILALAQKQAMRDEALSAAERRIKELESEVTELERELRLRQEQESVLKAAVRDADRLRQQQEKIASAGSLDIEYLKNTVIKLMETGEAEVLLPVLSKLLGLSADEEAHCRGAIIALKESKTRTQGKAFGLRQRQHGRPTSVEVGAEGRGAAEGSGGAPLSFLEEFMVDHSRDDEIAIGGKWKGPKSIKKRKRPEDSVSDSVEGNPYGLEFFGPEDFEALSPPDLLPPKSARPSTEHPRIEEAKRIIFDQMSHQADEFLRQAKEQGSLSDADIKELEAKLGAMDFAEWSSIDEHPFVFADLPDEGDCMERLQAEGLSLVEQLNRRFRAPGYIWFEEDEHGMPVVKLAHRDGQEVTVQLHGANITSWKRVDGEEAIFVRPDATFDTNVPLNSGTQFVFPQYGPGTLPKDGLVNNAFWEVVATEIGVDWIPDPAPAVILRCSDTEETRKVWPHKFEIFYKITIGEADDFPSPIPSQAEIDETYKVDRSAEEEKPVKGPPAQPEEDADDDIKSLTGGKDKFPTQLRMEITVKNLGDEDMEFMCALKPHFKVKDLCFHRMVVNTLGLCGKDFFDYTVTPGRPRLRADEWDHLYFGAGGRGIDRIYVDASEGDLYFCPGDRVHYEFKLRDGFRDVVAWNPGDEDIETAMWARYCAVLSGARIARPVRLKPGKEWYADQAIRFHQQYWREPVFGYSEDVPPPKFPDMDALGDNDE